MSSWKIISQHTILWLNRSLIISCFTLLILSLCSFCPAGNKVEKVSPPSSEDSGAPVNKPAPETTTSVPSSPPSLWITERAATASNTLAESVYKSFTSSSLLRVLMHTTQPMFNGRTKHISYAIKIWLTLPIKSVDELIKWGIYCGSSMV